MVLKLCSQFSCTPSQLDEEEAEIVRLVGIVARGTKAADQAGEG